MALDTPPLVSVLVSPEDLTRVLRRMASSIDEAIAGEDVALVGIQRGGAPLARRLAELLGRTVDVGFVDIAFYRDDVSKGLPDPRVGPTSIDFELEGRHVILVDDVLQTGRTVRAAIEALSDYGRPKRIWFAALVDRGGRELPIAADFIGRTIDVPAGARVVVDPERGALIEGAAQTESAG